MAKPSPYATGSDSRPRIYIAHTKPTGAAWRVGIHTRPRFAETAALAFHAAMTAVDWADAVIIYGTLGGPEGRPATKEDVNEHP